MIDKFIKRDQVIEVENLVCINTNDFTKIETSEVVRGELFLG